MIITGNWRGLRIWGQNTHQFETYLYLIHPPGDEAIFFAFCYAKL